jgi:hypothetical protein
MKRVAYKPPRPMGWRDSDVYRYFIGTDVAPNGICQIFKQNFTLGNDL